MSEKRIAIITCSNATQELDCCSVSCLRDLYKRLGSFKRYPPEEPLRLIGIISCAGCPTVAYPEKILRKINSLVQFRVGYIHFTYCMVALCPFLKKYTDVIKKAYPNIELVEGTHEAHISHDEFREKVVCAFKSNKKMPDVILGRV
ncbi:MAG: CGGC domain-containing protein [Thermoanaerobacteraceae bacterium]|nr:CGGC domain-containing protein [Thermoanaerobacteraceae bacterium]